MKNEILNFLSKYTTISKEVEASILESSLIKKFEKGTVLLKKGDLSRESYLVLKGCMRSYYLIDGVEKTTSFYTEEYTVIPLSYGKETPSEHYLECTEQTIASVGTPEMETDMLQKYPELEVVCRIMSEVFLSKSQEAFDEYILNSPEERYLNLLKNRPDLFQRLPQYQIASYLGITAESFSRLRKRISTRNK